MTAPGGPCRFCNIEEGRLDRSRETVVYQDELWSIGVLPKRSVPGWVTLWAREHYEGLAALPADVAGSFGSIAVTAAKAITEVCNLDNVYVAGFYENSRHFHVLLAGRPPGITAAEAGAGLLVTHDHLMDPDEALRIGELIGSRVTELTAARRTV